MNWLLGILVFIDPCKFLGERKWDKGEREIDGNWMVKEGVVGRKEGWCWLHGPKWKTVELQPAREGGSSHTLLSCLLLRGPVV